MAEAIGVVASGITIGTIAAQITSSIVKLKSYWDEVQDAPQDIQDLLEEVDILRHLLTAIADSQRQNPASSLILDSSSISSCLLMCKKEVDQLQELTDSLDTNLDAKSRLKRRWASTKVVMKKDKVERYKRKLERAIRLLSLSQQTYGMALLQLQPDIIAAKLSQTTTSLAALTLENFSSVDNPAAPSDNPMTETSDSPVARIEPSSYTGQPWGISSLLGTVKYSKRCYSILKRIDRDEPGRQEEREETIVEYRAPPWLIHRAWRIQAVKSRSGWNFCPRTYNEVPNDSPIFMYAASDDVKGIQDLFEKREASPYDRDDMGITPLHCAALRGRYSTCKLLIELGADTGYREHYSHRLPIDIVMLNPLQNVEALLDVTSLLIQETDLELDLRSYRGPKEGFSIWQQNADPLYYEKPLQERIEVAIALTANPSNGPDVFRMSLALGPLPSLTPSMTNSEDLTPLHAVARALGRIKSFGDSWFTPEQCEVYQMGWRVLLKELIVKRSSLHPISMYLSTPFLELLWGLFVFGDREAALQCKEPSLPLLLKNWLEDLQECGVDLEECGRVESELYEQERVDWDWSWDTLQSDGTYKRATWFLSSLKYGPSPSDWKVEMEYQNESAAENLGKMPGGWIEDDGSGTEAGEMEEGYESEEEEGSEGETENHQEKHGEQGEHE